MSRLSSQTIFHSFLYGGASVLLALDIILLAKAVATENFVPVVPILAGIFIAAGLLLVIYAEQKNREQIRQEHRRLSRVAHQLESPLRGLQEEFEALQANAGKLPADQRLKIKQIDSKTKILLENIRDVFLMLRAEQSPIAQEVRTYDICQLVSHAIEQAKPLASARNVDITTTHHCQEAAAKVDRRLFLVALTHLIENGILYNISPGIVNIAVTKGQNSLRIIVQDRGIGIKAQDADSVFLPFARGDKAEQYDPNGIGVGLTLARSIIEEFGGKITWKNRENTTGAEFAIQLPLVKTD